MKKIGYLLFFLSSILSAQPWSYNFGTVTGTHSSGESLKFLPDPQTSGGTDARVRIGSQGGSFNLENQIISFGSDSYLRGVAATGNSVNKFSIYGYTSGSSFTLRFTIRLGASDGSATGATDGNWHLFIGNGSNFSNSNQFSSSEVFSGIRWSFGTSGSITTNVHNGSSWVSTGISGTPFIQGATYIVDVYGNNSSTTINYTYGTSQSVASNTFDLWVNGVLVGDDLAKSGLVDLNNIDSWMFYGASSTSNEANIFIDDIFYTNTIATNPLPVELTSFSASVVYNGVKLNWRTETEVNNYGFEILRSAQNDNWKYIGFVEGNGNSNSPKKYSFVDNNVISGKYAYRLKQIDNDGTFEYSKVIEIDMNAPLEFELSQNYPNPFNPSTTIKFSLPITSNVKLSVFNILGEEVQILLNETKEAGVYTINFNASQLNSGIYLYQIIAANFVKVRKMSLLK